MIRSIDIRNSFAYKRTQFISLRGFRNLELVVTRNLAWVCLLVVGLTSTGFPSCCLAEEIRTWTDSTGKFTIEAKFVSEQDGVVKLERADGKSVEIPVNKLSEGDQKFLTALKENPFKTATDAENPFMPAKDAGNPTTATGASPTAPTTGGAINWSRSTEINLDEYDNGWDVVVAGDAELDFVPKSVKLPQRVDFFEGLKALRINRTARAAVAGYLWNFGSRNQGPQTRVAVVDFENGRVTGEATVMTQMVPMALHPDGQRMLMSAAERGEVGLEIWNVSGKDEADRMQAFDANNPEWKKKGKIQWAQFADGQTLVTKNEQGWVVVWNFETLEPICHFAIDGGCSPELSADGTLLAFYKSERVGLFDVKTQEVVALQKAPRRLNWPKFAFSPTEKRLACAAFDGVLVWNIETGELYRDFAPSGIPANQGVEFAHEDFLLIGGRYLIELENMISLWDYQGSEQTVSVGGVTFFCANPQGAPGMLLAAKLPHDDALTALDNALNQPDLFIFRKGSSVRLDVSGVPANHQAEVEASLRNKLQEMDVTVSNTAPLTVKAETSGPKADKIRYIAQGTYDVQVYTSTIKFLYEGKVAWQRSGSNIPHFVRIGRDENLGDVLREKSKGPDYSIFKTAEFPKFLQKPSDAPAAGASGQTIGSSVVTQGAAPTGGARPTGRRPAGRRPTGLRGR